MQKNTKNLVFMYMQITPHIENEWQRWTKTALICLLQTMFRGDFQAFHWFLAVKMKIEVGMRTPTLQQQISGYCCP